MNKTKRKIFETSMKLFAEKGYDATSIEEITATVGVAKGTLYYHFSSKEEIFNFLVEEGIKLLQNSVDIKTAKFSNYIDKLKAIVLIQIKIVDKYEDLITILLSQFWGNESRNQMCKNQIFLYINQIEQLYLLNNYHVLPLTLNLLKLYIPLENFDYLHLLELNDFRQHLLS